MKNQDTSTKMPEKNVSKTAKAMTKEGIADSMKSTTASRKKQCSCSTKQTTKDCGR